MAKTKADYIDDGRKAMQDGMHRRDWPFPPTSWQGKAFVEGYEAEKARLAASAVLQESSPMGTVTGRFSCKLVAVEDAQRTKPLIPFLSTIPNLPDWPEGAREHAIQLRLELGKEIPAHRFQRLQRSLQRLIARHSA